MTLNRPADFVRALVATHPAGMAALSGDRGAQALLSALGESEFRRELRAFGFNATKFADWVCPTCGGPPVAASGRSATIRCSRGHVRNARPNDPGDPVLRTLLGTRR
jgi:hypothetical protein